MDRETVIKCLEACTSSDDCAGHSCPLWDFDDSVVSHGCRIQMELDALALLKGQERTINELQNAYGYLQKQFFEAQDKLLKEQEAVEPKTDKMRNRICPKCNTVLRGRFCHECGQAVKWE